MVKMESKSIWRGICLLIAACFFGLTGCGKSGVAAGNNPDEGLPPEAVAVRKAFESSDPSYKNPVSEMLKLVKAGGANAIAYSEALPQAQVLAANPTMNAEQKQALEAMVQKMKLDIAASRRQ